MMNATRLSTFCVNFDYYADYVPVISSFTNLIDLFLKYAVHPCLSKTNLKQNHYFTYLYTKSPKRCLCLLIPFIGNIFIAIPCISSFIKRFSKTVFGTKTEIYSSEITTKDGKIYFRMEPLTKENESHWERFKGMSEWVANGSTGGILKILLLKAGREDCPAYGEDIKDGTGFTQEEYKNFIQESIKLKKEKCNIAKLIGKNSIGIGHMETSSEPDTKRYIVYATLNPHFSIQKSDAIMAQGKNLKNFFEAYKDILITVGSDFSNKKKFPIMLRNEFTRFGSDFLGEKSFHNRGISRNPYWVFKGKYAGLSMLLHGFSARVATQHFPMKEYMIVKPTGSMQTIINKSLHAEDAFIFSSTGKKEDVITLKTFERFENIEDAPESPMNFIKISALTRFFKSD